MQGGKEHGVPILISEIHPNQPAHRCQQLYIGDAILSVNGIDLRSSKHAEAVHILSQQVMVMMMISLFMVMMMMISLFMVVMMMISLFMVVMMMISLFMVVMMMISLFMVVFGEGERRFQIFFYEKLISPPVLAKEDFEQILFLFDWQM